MRQYWNSSQIIARKYGKKANKYGARPKTVDGIRFDSTLEAEYYVYLKAKLFIGQYKQSLWLIRKSGKNWVKEAIYA